MNGNGGEGIRIISVVMARIRFGRKTGIDMLSFGDSPIVIICVNTRKVMPLSDGNICVNICADTVNPSASPQCKAKQKLVYFLDINNPEDYTLGG